MTLVSTQIIDVVTTVGFPITMSLLFFWDKIKNQEITNQILTQNTAVLKEIKEILRCR